MATSKEKLMATAKAVMTLNSAISASTPDQEFLEMAKNKSTREVQMMKERNTNIGKYRSR